MALIIVCVHICIYSSSRLPCLICPHQVFQWFDPLSLFLSLNLSSSTVSFLPGYYRLWSFVMVGFYFCFVLCSFLSNLYLSASNSDSYWTLGWCFFWNISSLIPRSLSEMIIANLEYIPVYLYLELWFFFFYVHHFAFIDIGFQLPFYHLVSQQYKISL